MNGKARLHAEVFGEVQGVGFRAFVLRRAMGLGLTGWVRNRFDGSVELIAEGSRVALEVAAGRCRPWALGIHGRAGGIFLGGTYFRIPDVWPAVGNWRRKGIAGFYDHGVP